MIIDAHCHVLPGGMPPGHYTFRRELGRALHAQARKSKPFDDLPALIEATHPKRIIELQRAVGIDKSVILAVAPSDYTRYDQRGTVDLGAVTGVPGEPSIDKANDYVAAIADEYSESLVGFASVNPRYRGWQAAVDELYRAIEHLGLRGLKLYPMYDHWSVEDKENAFPVFEAAQSLDIPVMIHFGATPAGDTVLSYGRPLAVDEVARRFPELRLLICHVGYPWMDETIAICAKHEHVYMDLSYFISITPQRTLIDLVSQARRIGCSLERICWGTDYPVFLDVDVLLAKVGRLSDDGEITDQELADILGGNAARFVGGLEWNYAASMEQIEPLRAQWRNLDIP